MNNEIFKYNINIDFIKNKDIEPIYNQLKSNYELIEPCCSVINSKGIEIYYYNKFVFLMAFYDINVYNQIDLKDECIDNIKIQNEYELGYIAGLKDFEKKYSTTILFDKNSNLDYAKVLHEKYYHADINGFKDGWIKFIKIQPFAISNKYIFDIGYYTAMIHSTNELIDTNPILFKDFHFCNKIDKKLNSPQKNIEKEFTSVEYTDEEFNIQLDSICKKENLKIKALNMDFVLEELSFLYKNKYMTNKQFIEFINFYFLDDSSINIENIKATNIKAKGLFISYFYNFYNKSLELGIHRNKKPFIDIILSITNYTKSSIEAFFKPNKIKKQ